VKKEVNILPVGQLHLLAQKLEQKEKRVQNEFLGNLKRKNENEKLSH
jgi:hypothetical protein